MRPQPFALERYFAQHEFTAKYLLCSSDCDGWKQSDILALADAQTRKLWDELRLGYTESLGLPLLREEIAKLYKGVGPEHILTAVPEEAIFIAMSSLLERGDHVVATFPGYQSLYQLAESMGCAVSRWQPRPDAGCRFDVDDLAKLLRPDTKLIVVNFPHNPTGYLPPKKDLEKIVELAKQKGIYLFSDEMYRFLEHDSKDRLPSACELYDKAVVLFGMSKTFGLAGARLGWLVAKDPALYQRFAAFKDYTTICGSAPSEVLSLIALRAKDVIIAKHQARISRNLALLDQFFAKHSASFRWTRPKAGTIAFPQLLKAKDAEEFCTEVLRKTGVLLLPSTVYAYDRPCFRIGFGRENMPEALRRFDAFL